MILLQAEGKLLNPDCGARCCRSELRGTGFSASSRWPVHKALEVAAEPTLRLHDLTWRRVSVAPAERPDSQAAVEEQGGAAAGEHRLPHHRLVAGMTRPAWRRCCSRSLFDHRRRVAQCAQSTLAWSDAATSASTRRFRWRHLRQRRLLSWQRSPGHGMNRSARPVALGFRRWSTSRSARWAQLPGHRVLNLLKPAGCASWAPRTQKRRARRTRHRRQKRWPGLTTRVVSSRPASAQCCCTSNAAANRTSGTSNPGIGGAISASPADRAL